MDATNAVDYCGLVDANPASYPGRPCQKAITTVDDPANFVGSFSSISIGIDGLPVISYLDVNAGGLKVARLAS